MSVGAECLPGGGVEFRVWAPGHESVVLEYGRNTAPMQPEANGYFRARVSDAGPGTLYRYRVDDAGPYADPISRFQPQGPQGPSEVIDPAAYAWSDAHWRGVTLLGEVVYELHVDTFTDAGTFAAAEARLDHLRDLGITTIELMPLSDFVGDFGWGYDGVNPFAPHRRYGRPDDLRRFVDAAHRMGIAVILDVVYNHFGPSANYFPKFSAYYASTRGTDWGAALNFDGEQSRPVRDMVCENVEYWIREFHLDGFRLDATQNLYDTSPEHIIAELTRRARAAAGERSIIIVAENEPQDTKLLRPAADGGYALDGVWNDDFHHSAVVALTGRREAYYTDYSGRAQEFVAAAQHGYLFQGQYYLWQKQRRGSSTRGLAPYRFLAYLENHDQVSNSSSGQRLAHRTHPASLRAMTSLLLLGPWTPLLFQGQEWSSTRPFPFFAQLGPELATSVHQGRKQQLSEFPSLASRAVQDGMPDPGAPATFAAAKLDWGDERNSERAQCSLRLHRDLLRLRHTDRVLRPDAKAELAAAVLSDSCLCLRWFAPDSQDRLLIINLDRDLTLLPAPEPLLAPPARHYFRALFSSEEPRYGGLGQRDEVTDEQGIRVSGCSALLFEAVPYEEI
jgi:maltooligosyltrehalose trehalohydrolase